MANQIFKLEDLAIPEGFTLSGVQGEAWIENSDCQRIRGRLYPLQITYYWDEESGDGEMHYDIYEDPDCEKWIDHFVCENVRFDVVGASCRSALNHQKERLSESNI